jgi:hypothetical protein
MLQEEVAEVLEVSLDKFKAWNGWLDRLTKKCGIKARIISFVRLSI